MVFPKHYSEKENIKKGKPKGYCNWKTSQFCLNVALFTLVIRLIIEEKVKLTIPPKKTLMILPLSGTLLIKILLKDDSILIQTTLHYVEVVIIFADY